jgi:hypothetical protein
MTAFRNPRVEVSGVMVFVAPSFRDPKTLNGEELMRIVAEKLPEVFNRYPCKPGCTEEERLQAAVRCLSAWARGLEMSTWRPEHHADTQMEQKILVAYMRQNGIGGLEKMFREYRIRHPRKV